MKLIYTEWIPFRHSAIALWPFVFMRKKLKHKENNVLINHERIHLRQQLELLLIGFYILYILHYFFLLIRFKNHSKAYKNIIFEKEAYARENDLQYLKNRKLFSFIRFF